MARLKIGDSIPKLKGDTLSGENISLSDYKGNPLILMFYRYAGCQFCNLRMNDFTKRYNEEYQEKGIQAISVFQSPINKMQKYTTEHEAPFEIISDPTYQWYERFGLEKSWIGLARVGFRLIDLSRSIAKGYARIDPDGAMNRLPADFLINAHGVIDETYYGKDIGDHIPFSRIEDWINNQV